MAKYAFGRLGMTLVGVLAALALTGSAFGQPMPGPSGGDAQRAMDSARGAGAGPAGNTHPRGEVVAADAERYDNPFGPARSDGAVTPAGELKAFERRLDLGPLRDLAVFHNGRVKIVDTLARETVRTLTGDSAYSEPLDPGDPSAGEAEFDAVFTWLDLMIDPARYAGKPLLGVDYLPLREAFLRRAFPEDAGARLRWKKMTRISPAMFATLSGAIFDRHMGEPEYRSAIGRVDRSMRLYTNGTGNLLLVAPPERDAPWRHLASLPGGSPARRAAADLGRAWRARDAEGVNAAAAALASALPEINPAVYPDSRRSLELAYNRAAPFEYGMWIYLVSLVSLVLAFGTGRRWLLLLGSALLVLGVSVHAGGFAMRCVIAERFAIQNQFESMTGLSLFAAVVGLGLLALRRQALFGAASAAVGFLALIGATQTDMPGQMIEREAAILNTSVLLKYHVTTVLTSYGLITLGFVTSLFYLGTHYAARFSHGAAAAARISRAALVGPGEPGRVAMAGGGGSGGGASGAGGGGRAPTLARTLSDLDTAQLTVLQLAFWTLGVGILLGAWWADHSWGRWWAFDPKETWALITWIIYLIVIHVRIGSGARKGLLTAWLSVLGFIVMLWTYFGVNLLLPGLHAYA